MHNEDKSHELKARIFTIVPIIIMIIGLLVCLSPIVSNIQKQSEANHEIESVAELNSTIDAETKEGILEQARAYNARLGNYQDNRVTIGDDQIASYDEQLTTDNSDAMGWIEIPKANIKAAINHGVGDDALAMGAGHQPETSLPIGGETSNCFISGHSGLPEYQIFDNLRVLNEGDLILIHVLDDIYAYRVTDWSIEAPEDIDFELTDGVDKLTLITCTTDPDAFNPKGRTGINDKRLVIEAERCEYVPEEAENTASDIGVYVNDFTRPFLIASSAIALLIIVMVVITVRRRHNNKKLNEEQKKRI